MAARAVRKEVKVDCLPIPVKNIREPVNPAGVTPTGVASRTIQQGQRFYLTTAINYTNGWPHIGHAYEAIVSDIISRHHRIYGDSVFFCTGTDEHGQKIAAKAEADGLKPIDGCTIYKNGFVALNERLNISNDHYIRTTDASHKATAQKLWQMCEANGDIYLDSYVGYYLVREERFITDQEAEEWGFKDPSSGAPLTKVSEASYFFRMSKYHDWILAKIKEDDEFISPAQYRSEIIARLEKEPLRDLSISRTSFDWGIPVPGADKHVMYVWFDALSNYLSAVDGLNSANDLSKFWPCDAHVVGKDIIWFHCIIWPCILKSACISLPKKLLVHGFVLDKDGRKMSKSLGNVVDPHDILEKYPADSMRWYLTAEYPLGGDIRYTEEGMRLVHNADLCDRLGNLVSRALSLCGGRIPVEDPVSDSAPFDLELLTLQTKDAFKRNALSEAAMLVRQATTSINEWLTKQEPWKVKDQVKKNSIIRTTVEYVYIVSHFWAPFIPIACAQIFDKFAHAPKVITDLATVNLEAGRIIPEVTSVLFKVQEAPEAPVVVKKAVPVVVGASPFAQLELRAGKIVHVANHPEADRLYVEKIDLGEPSGPRQIVSGLRANYTLEQMLGRTVIVVANLKPRKMMGVESAGMVLCAKEGDKVELIDVQGEVAIGQRIVIEGEAEVPALDAKQADKLKLWDAVVPELKTDAEQFATFQGKRIAAGSLLLKAPTLASAPIS